MSPDFASKLGTDISPGPNPIIPSGAIPSKYAPVCLLPQLQSREDNGVKSLFENGKRELWKSRTSFSQAYPKIMAAWTELCGLFPATEARFNWSSKRNPELDVSSDKYLTE